MKNPAQAQAQAPGLGYGFRSCEAPSSSSSTVECCMCGDVGFQDRLFRCRRCRDRLQHTYCSRLYSPELKEDSFNVCDWCLDNEAKQQPTKKICCQSQVSAQSSQSHGEKPAIRFHFKFKKSSSTETAPEQQQAAAELDNKDKEKDRDSPRSSSGTSSSKAFGGARRYKLLSDVLC